MGDETANGTWNNPYAVQFPFSIGERQYFYGQNQSTNYWFVQELLSGGQMGPETDNGRWEFSYGAQFPFLLNGRQYFYGQGGDEKNWFLQELLPGGKMGEETDHGSWNNYYGTQFAFPSLVHGHLYFYGQNLKTKYWFVQELVNDLSSGMAKMGAEVSSGGWNNPYQIQLAFSLEDIPFFYGNRTGEGHNWFIQQLVSLDEYTIRKTWWSNANQLEMADITKQIEVPSNAPRYGVGWLPYLGDWKNYVLKYGLLSGIQYHDPSTIEGVGLLVKVENGNLIGEQLKSKQCEILVPRLASEGYYSWALVPGGDIMYVWNSHLKLESKNYVRHSDLNGGNPVICAGEFTFSKKPSSTKFFLSLDEIYIEINDSSGHYKPDGNKCFSFVHDVFKELGFDTSKVVMYARKLTN